LQLLVEQHQDIVPFLSNQNESGRFHMYDKYDRSENGIVFVFVFPNSRVNANF